MIFYLTTIITSIYLLFELLLLWHWLKVPVFKNYSQRYDGFSTVLVPVRNESATIENLIHSIQNGHTNLDEFEIIVVDDHSEDDTAKKVRSLCTQYENLFLAQLPRESEGKKAAITYGVTLAKADLIVCTDGDCEVDSEWLNCHRQAYFEKAMLSFGPVEFFNLGKSLIVDVLDMELSALVAMGGATLHAGHASMINGCNYSFSKKAFESVGGYQGNDLIPTGDDEFLLRKIFATYPNGVRFLKTKRALVVSRAPQSISEFYNQRRRWASKWRFHRDTISKLTPVFLFLSYMLWSFAMFQVIIGDHQPWLMILICKWLMDFVYITASRRFLGKNASLLSFGLLQIIYPIYVVFFGVASNFGKYSWRERIHKI